METASTMHYTDQLHPTIGEPWDLTVIYILQDLGLVADVIYPILANVYFFWAWKKYKKFKHDRILIITLMLFEAMIITRFIQNIFNNINWSRNSLWYRIVNATVVPLIYALSVCAVYFFVF